MPGEIEDADRRALEAILRRLAPDARLLAAQPLQGGISAGIHAVSLEDAAGRSEAVLRVLPARPDLEAPIEAQLMRTLSSLHFPVPEVRAHAPGEPGQTRGALLLERIEGIVDPTPDAARVDQLAGLLRRLHALPAEAFTFLGPAHHPALPERWPDVLDPGRIAALVAIAGACPPAAAATTALCHGDFWAGNLLWRGDGSVVVLDWEDAVLADPLHDLAITRLELRWEAGAPTMGHFTERYLHGHPDAAALRAALPAWDLHETLRRLAWLPGWGLPEAKTAHSLTVSLEHAEAAARRLSAP